MKLLHIYYLKDHFLPSNVMTDANFQEDKSRASSRDTDMESDDYIGSIAKSVALKVGSIFRER